VSRDEFDNHDRAKCQAMASGSQLVVPAEGQGPSDVQSRAPTHGLAVAHRYRFIWSLIVFAFFYIIAFWVLDFVTLSGNAAPGWDLDDRPIVPGSSIEATGYGYTIDTRYGGVAAGRKSP
jgi:hypothetical protein